VTSFTAFDPYQKPQYVQQFTASVQKSLGRRRRGDRYHGERGLHLQRAHLINNALPGPVWCSTPALRERDLPAGHGLPR